MATDINGAIKLIDATYRTNAITFHNNFTILMGGEIAVDTPQDTGRAKGNWDAGFSPEITPTKNRDLTRTASFTMAKMRKQLANGGPEKISGRTTYIKNGVESDNEGEGGYIIKLENGGSDQAPVGMLYLNMAQADRIAARAMKL
jgi:hypothetical protein